MGLKLKGSYDTEIYITDVGFVAIKQPDIGRGGDTIVVLSPDQLSIVANELLRLDSTKHEWYVDPETIED